MRFLKRFHDRLRPNSACETSIIDFSLYLLRHSIDALEVAAKEDGMKEDTFFDLWCEAIACVVNASRVEIDLAGESAKHKPTYEGILAGVVTVAAGVTTVREVFSKRNENVTRRVIRHLVASRKNCLAADRAGVNAANFEDDRSAMLASLVSTSLVHLGIDEEKGGACLILLLKLATEQSRVTFSHIMSTTQ